MKKTYMAPEMAITKIATQQMLASSLLDTKGATPTQDDFTETTEDIENNLSRRYDVWDDYE